MSKLTGRKDSELMKNIITAVICAVVSVFVGIAAFLSGFDWHDVLIFNNSTQVGTQAEIGDAIPESSKKEDWTYFDDTVFVGDSISYGMASYGYLSFDHVFAKIGLHQGTALTYGCVYTSQTNKYTLTEAVKMARPGKIIVTLGINAIYSCKSDSFYDNYTKLINNLKEASPDSKIIIQSIFPVTQKYAINNGKANYNQQVAYANQKIAALAKDLDCYFLYTYEVLTDENGYMQSEYSSDGIHLSRKGYETVFEYILSHPIISSGYFTEIGAIRPPVVVSPVSSEVTLPDIGEISSIGADSSQPSESDAAQSESQGSSSDTSSETSSNVSSNVSSNASSNVSSSEQDVPADTSSSVSSEQSTPTVPPTVASSDISSQTPSVDTPSQTPSVSSDAPVQSGDNTQTVTSQATENTL